MGFSPLYCLRYDSVIVFRRQNHITFIFRKTMSHNHLVQQGNQNNRPLNGLLFWLSCFFWSSQFFSDTCHHSHPSHPSYPRHPFCPLSQLFQSFLGPQSIRSSQLSGHPVHPRITVISVILVISLCVIAIDQF